MYRVLLVEDNEANRDMLSRRLIRHGWEVVLAADGREALRMARVLHPDLVLMDLRMPEVDGWEAIRQLKSAIETREIPVIALTAHAMAGERERALDAGSDDFETKPLVFPRLLQKMVELVACRSASSSLLCGSLRNSLPVARPDGRSEGRQNNWAAYAGR